MLSVLMKLGHLFHEAIDLKSGLRSNFEVMWDGTSNFLLAACLVLDVDKWSLYRQLMFSELLFCRAF